MLSDDPIDLTVDPRDLLPRVIIDEWLPSEDESILFLFQQFDRYPPQPSHYILPPNLQFKNSIMDPSSKFHLLPSNLFPRYTKTHSKSPNTPSYQSLFNPIMVIQSDCLLGFLSTGWKLDVQLILGNSGRLRLPGFRNTLSCHQLGNSVATFYLAFPPFPGHGVLPIPMISPPYFQIPLERHTSVASTSTT